MAFFVVWRCWGWPRLEGGAADRAAAADRAGVLHRQHAEDLRGRAGCRSLIAGAARAHHVHLGAGLSSLLAKITRKNEADLDWLVRKLEAKPPHRVPGTAVFLTGDPTPRRPRSCTT